MVESAAVCPVSWNLTILPQYILGQGIQDWTK